MRSAEIQGVPYSLLTEGWWLDHAYETDTTTWPEGPRPPTAPLGARLRQMGTGGLALACLIGLVILADVLFWHQRLGLSLAAFALTLIGAATLIAHHTGRISAGLVRPWLIAIAALAPVIENLSPLSLSLASLGTLISLLAVIMPKGSATALWARTLAGLMARLPVSGTVSLGAALRQLGQTRSSTTSQSVLHQSLARWAMPTAFTIVFLVLITSANPVIEVTLANLAGAHWIAMITAARIAFWLSLAYLAWPLIMVGVFVHADDPEDDLPDLPANDLLASVGFNQDSVSNALVAFNLLFALQTGLDLAYLWLGSASLPEGVTYAQYAHRGAYPLIVTALLAGLFAIACRPFIASHRRLLFWLALWLGQTIALTLSALYRLDLYVTIYGLTYLRLAAFIWMGLVAAGLGLIVVQTLCGRPNSWLISRTFALASATLYLCCFVNWANLIARTNLEHPPSPYGRSYDADYLCMLGPLAEPARRAHGLVCADATLPQIDGWRDFTFRSWRVQRYLLAQDQSRPQ